MHQLVLASQSPRRSQLLKEAGYRFTVDPVKVSEIIDENLTLEAALLGVARTKVQALLDIGKYSKNQGFLILGADTEVIHRGRVLGKPKNSTQAAAFLRDLSGIMHEVKTALVLCDLDLGREFTHVETSKVTFGQLSETQISAYVATGAPLDKAGGYGLQDPLVENFVERVEGSRSNIVGLPLEAFARIVADQGYELIA